MNPDRDSILELIRALRIFAQQGVIIVEGKKDVSALERFAIPSEPLTTSIDIQFERLANDSERVLILTDRDRTGRKLLAQARAACERLELEEERALLTRFFAETGLRQVEGFDTLCERLGIETDKNDTRTGTV
ncbi:MAG: toprim domain-containing protein [Candidatus Woesearchaeota archaeon]